MRFINIIGACVLLIGCQPGIIDELPIEQPRLVVQGEPEDGKPWKVYVGHTYATLDTMASFPRFPGSVPGASVKILDNGQFAENLTATGSLDSIQSYVSGNGPQQGHTYTIKVEAPSYKPVTASYTHPSPVAIDDVEFEITQAELTNFNSEYQTVIFRYNINVTFTDPPGDNYYQLILMLSTGPDPYNSQYSIREYMSSLLADERNNRTTLSGTLIDDKKISGKKVSLPFETFTNGTVVADTVAVPYVSVILRSLSKEYFDFSKYLASPGPFYYDPYAQPSIVKTNIDGGLGIFAGYSTSRHTFKLKKP
jgi:hypothetical protein